MAYVKANKDECTKYSMKSSFARMHVPLAWMCVCVCASDGISALVIMWICAAPFEIARRILQFRRTSLDATYFTEDATSVAIACVPVIRNEIFRFHFFVFSDLMNFSINFIFLDAVNRMLRAYAAASARNTRLQDAVHHVFKFDSNVKLAAQSDWANGWIRGVCVCVRCWLWLGHFVFKNHLSNVVHIFKFST